MTFSLFLYCSFCYFSYYTDFCSCNQDDYKFSFRVESGLYCCSGEALNLTQQCHNECNFYGFDPNRNYLNGKRSYLDICKDNRYKFKPQFLSIRKMINLTLLLELVLMKLNCVRESHYV